MSVSEVDVLSFLTSDFSPAGIDDLWYSCLGKRLKALPLRDTSPPLLPRKSSGEGQRSNSGLRLSRSSKAEFRDEELPLRLDKRLSNRGKPAKNFWDLFKVWNNPAIKFQTSIFHACIDFENRTTFVGDKIVFALSFPTKIAQKSHTFLFWRCKTFFCPTSHHSLLLRLQWAQLKDLFHQNALQFQVPQM